MPFYRMNEKPSAFLTREKREVLRMTSTIQNYKRENRNFINQDNTQNIEKLLYELAHRLEKEVKKAKEIEQWLEED